LLNKRRSESIRKARDLFEQAVARDPQFALGHSGIADAYILLGEYGEISSAEASRLARPKVASALAIDNSLAEGHVSRAMLLAHFEWDWPAAELEYRKAIELNPNNTTARHWYGLHLAELGRFDEALREIDVARKHDPLAPILRAAKGKILFVARRYDEAIDQCRDALDLEPNFAPALAVMGQIYASQKKFREAIETTRRYVDLAGGSDSLLEFAYIHAAAGDPTETDKLVQKVTSLEEGLSAYDMATICAARGDQENALRWLQAAIERRSVSVVWTRVDPRLDNARGDPRFAELVAKLAPHRPPSE
jgi:tetratricopeptide (TPR) repeat protein